MRLILGIAFATAIAGPVLAADMTRPMPMKAPSYAPAFSWTGTYVGASAEMSIAAGLGANVLVGGSNRSVALQPLSVQGQTGLNIAAGVSSLELHLAQ